MAYRRKRKRRYKRYNRKSGYTYKKNYNYRNYRRRAKYNRYQKRTDRKSWRKPNSNMMFGFLVLLIGGSYFLFRDTEINAGLKISETKEKPTMRKPPLIGGTVGGVLA